MATVNFTLSGNNLGIEVDNNDGNPTKIQSVASAGVSVIPTTDYESDPQGGLIEIYSSGVFFARYIWAPDVIWVNGEPTADIYDAVQKINALNFNGGGTAPSSNTSVVRYIDTVKYSNASIPVPANTVILSVYNDSNPYSLVFGSDWNQTGAGEDVTIDGVATDDTLTLTGWTYADVAPPDPYIPPKQFVMYIGDGGSPDSNVQIRKNSFAFDFVFLNQGTDGIYSCVAFDPTIHYMQFESRNRAVDFIYSPEDGLFFAYNALGVLSNDIFNTTGFIVITEYPI